MGRIVYKELGGCDLAPQYRPGLDGGETISDYVCAVCDWAKAHLKAILPDGDTCFTSDDVPNVTIEIPIEYGVPSIRVDSYVAIGTRKHVEQEADV